MKNLLVISTLLLAPHCASAGRGPSASLDAFDMTAAMHAAAQGNVSRLRPSLPELRERNSNNASVLYFAAQAQNQPVETFEYLRSRLGRRDFEEMLNQRVNSNGHTVAMEAVFHANEVVVDYLLGLSQEGVRVDFSAPTVFGWTPKTFAEREKLPFASRLPEGSIRVEDRVRWIEQQQAQWLRGLTGPEKEIEERGAQLISAIERFDVAGVEALVRDPARPVALNRHYGRPRATPLNSVSRPGFAAADLMRARQLLVRLIQLGADPNFAEGGIMQVPSGFRESVFGYEDLVQTTITEIRRSRPQTLRSYLNFQGPVNGYTKLIDAALRGRWKVMEVLLAAGADARIQGHNGLRARQAAELYARQSGEPVPARLLSRLPLGAVR